MPRDDNFLKDGEFLKVRLIPDGIEFSLTEHKDGGRLSGIWVKKYKFLNSREPVLQLSVLLSFLRMKLERIQASGDRWKREGERWKQF